MRTSHVRRVLERADGGSAPGHAERYEQMLPDERVPRRPRRSSQKFARSDVHNIGVAVG